MGSLYYQSSKTYEHSVGLSCCFRQWRASHSHCQYLHGYSLQVALHFESKELDRRNWVVDFGDLKEIKQWLQDTFDHKTVIAEDDPMLQLFHHLDDQGIIDLKVLPDVGCEKFAELIYNRVDAWLKESNHEHAYLKRVEVREHGGNSGIVEWRAD